MYYGLCDISGRRWRHWVASVECLGFRGSDLGTNGLCGNSGLRGLRWIACTCCQIFHLFCKLARHFLKLLRGGEGIWIQGLGCRVNLRRGLGIQNIGFGLGFQNFFWGFQDLFFWTLTCSAFALATSSFRAVICCCRVFTSCLLLASSASSSPFSASGPDAALPPPALGRNSEKSGLYYIY